MAMKRMVFGLGGAQVLISCLVFGGIAWRSVCRPGAVVIGGMLAMSSTAIVMKLLVEQLEQHSRHGRPAFGVLLFQDLVVVPFLIVIPALAGDTEQSVLDRARLGAPEERAGAGRHPVSSAAGCCGRFSTRWRWRARANSSCSRCCCSRSPPPGSRTTPVCRWRSARSSPAS